MPHNTAKEIGRNENCNRVALVFSIAAGAPGSGEKATSAATSERHIVGSGMEQTRGRFSSTLWQSAQERSANRSNSGHRGGTRSTRLSGVWAFDGERIHAPSDSERNRPSGPQDAPARRRSHGSDDPAAFRGRIAAMTYKSLSTRVTQCHPERKTPHSDDSFKLESPLLRQRPSPRSLWAILHRAQKRPRH